MVLLCFDYINLICLFRGRLSQTLSSYVKLSFKHVIMRVSGVHVSWSAVWRDWETSWRIRAKEAAVTWHETW